MADDKIVNEEEKNLKTPEEQESPEVEDVNTETTKDIPEEKVLNEAEEKENKIKETKEEEAKLAEILVNEGYVTEDDIKIAQKFAKANNVAITQYLYRESLINKNILGQAMAEHFGVLFANIGIYEPAREQILKIPEQLARDYNAVLFQETGDEITVATNDPRKEGLETELKKVFPTQRIKLAYAIKEDIYNVFIHYRKELDTRFQKIIEKQKKVAPEIIDEILRDALTHKTSDVHFEPQRDDVRIRFRIDGVLQQAGTINKKYYENILNRIKVQGQMRIDEHFSAQDGALRSIVDEQIVDVRISIIPTIHGEKITMRLLANYIQGFALSDIGLSERDQEMLITASKKPCGMILVTGPTGSGKSTTLYSVLKLLNRPEVNITTIEDPVEYKLQGVNQIKVNPKADLTFATGLRSIVRQDPDVILVGEIRDQETAEIAVNAALTGHLLLSTFHANDAATAIPRLLDMGIEPFLLASTIEIIIAQRLVRMICPNCRHSKTVGIEEIEELLPNAKEYFGDSEKITLYEGKGCDSCNQTGYKGRSAIFEFMPMPKEIQDLMLTNPSTKQLWEVAVKYGAHSLFEDGINRVKNGTTTIEELIRVAPPPEDFNAEEETLPEITNEVDIKQT